MPIPLDCPGSLLPVPHLQPGDGVRCDICGRKVYLAVPPHRSNQMKAKPGN